MHSAAATGRYLTQEVKEQDCPLTSTMDHGAHTAFDRMNLWRSKADSPTDTLKGKFSYLNTFIGKEEGLKIEDLSVCHIDVKTKANDTYKAETESPKYDSRKS